MDFLSVFSPNAGKYGVSLRIQSKCGKMRARITPNTDTFHVVNRVALISEYFPLKCMKFNTIDKNVTIFPIIVKAWTKLLLDSVKLFEYSFFAVSVVSSKPSVGPFRSFKISIFVVNMHRTAHYLLQFCPEKQP